MEAIFPLSNVSNVIERSLCLLVRVQKKLMHWLIFSITQEKHLLNLLRKLAAYVMGIHATALEIGAKNGSAAVSKNQKAALSTIPDVMHF